MVEIKKLKEDIKKKFKTIKHFSYSSGMDYYLLNKFFGKKLGSKNMDETKKEVYKYLESTECKPFLNNIMADEVEYLRRCILINYRSISQFITDNPQFSKSFISNVINGKRIKMDSRYNKFKDSVIALKSKPEELLRN
jgi:hypothetical protein